MLLMVISRLGAVEVLELHKALLVALALLHVVAVLIPLFE